MASGNTVILKHSAQTPLCAEQLYQSAKKTLPKDVFNYLHLNHEDGLKLFLINELILSLLLVQLKLVMMFKKQLTQSY